MSDDERVSMEELDAQLEMEQAEAEAAAAAAKKKKDAQKEEEEEEEDEGEQKEQPARDDSDDNSEKSDEAMEDNEEPEVDGDSREPSDGESIDGESGEEQESETEHEKRIRKSAALQFLDLEADEGTEKKILKHLKKKIADEDDAENAYEMDSIMDPEGEVVYDTDYERERKKKKKKGASNKKNKNKEDKNPKKRKRIRSPSSSENEESGSDGDGEEQEEEEEEEKEEKTKKKKKKAITLDVSDDEMEHMQTLGGTSSAHKVGGQASRPKAAFHDHSDIAKAAAEKKSRKVSAASLLDSPKQKPKAKPAAAAANKSDGSSSSKSPAKKPRAKKAPTLQVGEQFELKERGAPRVYRVTFRGEDVPLVMGPTSNKLELQSGVFHPRFFTTARALEEREDGEYDELDKFQLFFVSPGRAPKKVGVPWASSGWNTFNSMSAEEQYAYVIEALNNDNIVRRLDEDGNNTTRMMFTEPLMQQIKSEAVLNPDGEWKWMPKHVRLPDLITARDENGEPAVKAQAAAAGPNAKKKAVVQAKPKIDRVKETNSHDVSAMLTKKAQQQQVQNKTAAAAAWTSNNNNNSSSSSKKLTIDSKTAARSSSDVLDFFSASPEPPQDLFDNEATLERTKQLLAELIDMRHRRLVKMGNASTAGEEIQKSFEFIAVRRSINCASSRKCCTSAETRVPRASRRSCHRARSATRSDRARSTHKRNPSTTEP